MSLSSLFLSLSTGGPQQGSCALGTLHRYGICDRRRRGGYVFFLLCLKNGGLKCRITFSSRPLLMCLSSHPYNIRPASSALSYLPPLKRGIIFACRGCFETHPSFVFSSKSPVLYRSPPIKKKRSTRARSSCATKSRKVQSPRGGA